MPGIVFWKTAKESLRSPDNQEWALREHLGGHIWSETDDGGLEAKQALWRGDQILARVQIRL